MDNAVSSTCSNNRGAKMRGSSPRPIRWIVNEQGCHICTSHAKNKAGYTVVHRYIEGEFKSTLLHRYLWMQRYGILPAELFVCHICDNRCCINLDHLFVGTCQDNSDDMRWKNRSLTLGQRSTTKMDVDTAFSVMYDDTLPLKYWQIIAGTSNMTVNCIRRGMSWAKLFEGDFPW